MEQDNNVLMKCGHVASTLLWVDNTSIPFCPICNCSEPSTKTPNLSGRKAHCTCCGRLVDSDRQLPFFAYNKNISTDSYYCGCQGWE